MSDESKALIDRIEIRWTSMSKSETKVANIFVSDPYDFASLTVKEVSRMAHVSPPTVLRFCRSIGCTGFADLKLKLEKDLP